MRHKGIKIERRCLNCGKKMKGYKTRERCKSCVGKTYKESLRHETSKKPKIEEWKNKY